MTRRPILIYGHPCLTRVARPVGPVTGEVRQLAQDMIETMYDAPGRGLAAPQIGKSLRMFVFDCGWKDGAPRDPLVVIDPRVIWASEETVEFEEGCLSIPGLPMRIERPAAARMQWTGLDGAVQERRFDGTEAVCVQHEYDHLDGILISDRLPKGERAGIASALAELARSDQTA